MSKVVETGYVIMKPNTDGTNTYFRGCGRGDTGNYWAKSIRSAQIYKSAGNAAKSIATSNKIWERDTCRVLKVIVSLEEC